MKRYAAVALVALAMAGTPCHAQFLQKLQDTLIGGQGQGQQQGMMPGQQSNLLGNVNLPPGQYMMTNVQSGQAFYVAVQNGQMFLTSPGQQGAPQMMPGQGMFQQPGQGMLPQQGQGGMGGLIKNGLGNFLQNQLAPQQQQAPGLGQ